MKEETLKSWEEFEQALVRIDDETTALREEKQLHVPYSLFRGVTDSTWRLESTLERVRKQKMGYAEYRRIIQVVHKHVETCTGRKWNLDTEVDFGDFKLQGYEFMAYLRHNGFPSPLIDWTKSPYVAAFFAFRDIPFDAKREGHVSIFAYREICGTTKSWSDEEPHICSLGPTIATCATHYLQQSEYLVCVRKEDGKIHFANHEDVKGDGEQDLMTKYDIPTSEWEKALKILDAMNVTAYSLFDSEPSLMETLALRELILQ